MVSDWLASMLSANQKPDWKRLVTLHGFYHVIFLCSLFIYIYIHMRHQLLMLSHVNMFLLTFSIMIGMLLYDYPDSKVHGTNMGPTWGLSAPDGPHVGPMNLAIKVWFFIFHSWRALHLHVFHAFAGPALRCTADCDALLYLCSDWDASKCHVRRTFWLCQKEFFYKAMVDVLLILKFWKNQPDILIIMIHVESEFLCYVWLIVT